MAPRAAAARVIWRTETQVGVEFLKKRRRTRRAHGAMPPERRGCVSTAEVSNRGGRTIDVDTLSQDPALVIPLRDSRGVNPVASARSVPARHDQPAWPKT